MSIIHRFVLAATTAAVCATLSPMAEARPAARQGNGQPPYCVLIGIGPRGAELPQICRFYVYQQCLQAATDLRGNCVANIDYRGPPPDTVGAAWAR